MKQEKKTLVSQIKAARRVSVPILAITTPDPAATIETIVSSATKEDVAKVVWDVVEGLRPRNDAGKDAIGKMIGEFDATVGNPTEMLRSARRLAENGILFAHLANRWIVDAAFVQACWNLRDAFKADHRTLVLLGPSIDLPAELTGDIVVLDEPLPDAEALAEVVREQHANCDLKVDDERVTLAVEAVQGLPAFQAEQAVAMSLTTAGLDLPGLWERKRRQIELTPGLKVLRDPTRFADIGGVPIIKEFLKRIVDGQARPNAILFIDEIEKLLAGAFGSGGDSSGVSQDQLGTLLGYMQDNNAVGCIFVGPPGAAKSAVAKAVGNEAGIPTIQMDIGSMKGSLVGSSEANLRNALKVVTSVSNGRSLWIATCNNISELPPELRRRFTLGIFYFEIPTKEERSAIWRIWLGKYQLKTSRTELPDDEGWTGAEIKQCCDIAWRLGATLKDASQFVIPVSRSAAEQLDRLRKAAEGRFLSASRPGVYERANDSPESRTPGKRKLSLED